MISIRAKMHSSLGSGGLKRCIHASDQATLRLFQKPALLTRTRLELQPRLQQFVVRAEPSETATPKSSSGIVNFKDAEMLPVRGETAGPFPDQPGVYGMHSADSKLQYIGLSRKVCTTRSSSYAIFLPVAALSCQMTT